MVKDYPLGECDGSNIFTGIAALPASEIQGFLWLAVLIENHVGYYTDNPDTGIKL